MKLFNDGTFKIRMAIAGIILLNLILLDIRDNSLFGIAISDLFATFSRNYL